MNESRLEKLDARNKTIVKILNETQLSMIQMIQNRPVYMNLMQNLLTQGIVKLVEPRVFVRCLRRDVDLVREVIPSAIEHSSEIYKKEMGIDQRVEVSIDEEYFLEERQIPDLRGVDFKNLSKAQMEQIFTSKELDNKVW